MLRNLSDWQIDEGLMRIASRWGLRAAIVGKGELAQGPRLERYTMCVVLSVVGNNTTIGACFLTQCIAMDWRES